MSREQRDQIVNNIHNETLRLNSLASSFLDLARLESGRVQFRRMRFSVADLLYECRDVMMTKALETNIQIRIDVPNDMPLMEADRDKIKQVLLNLMSNAIKYNRHKWLGDRHRQLTAMRSCPSSSRIPAWASRTNRSRTFSKILPGA
jgi:signal transduction histidine kinase